MNVAFGILAAAGLVCMLITIGFHIIEMKERYFAKQAA
jgi:hypothetical protein